MAEESGDTNDMFETEEQDQDGSEAGSEEPMAVSEEKPMAVSEVKTVSPNNRFQSCHSKRFPEKLWEAACDESCDLISWTADGTSLFVHEDRFEREILDAYPGLVLVKSFTNFRRQLREYGFDWRQNQVQMLFHFSHPSFRRDAPRQAKIIETRRRSRTKQTMASGGAGKTSNKGKKTSTDATSEAEGSEGPSRSQIPFPLRNMNLPAGQHALMPCTQQNQSGMTYHVMPVVQPTQAYFIPFSGHKQELGGSGDHKKSDKENEEESPPGAPPSSSPQPSTSSGVSMVTMLPYFPQCSPWMQHFGPNLCSFPMQSMGHQVEGSTQRKMSSQAPGSPWNSTSPDQPKLKKMKLDFDWYGRITPIESSSPDRNSSSSMSTCASKGTPPDPDQ